MQPRRPNQPTQRPTQGANLLGLCLLATGLVACGEGDPEWTDPIWGTAPLDTRGANVVPPPAAALPNGQQPAAAPYNPQAVQPTEPVAPVDTGVALKLDDIKVTTTGWAACQFYDWRMLGLAPWPGIGALSSIPMFGASVYQAVKWGKKFFALSDINCDLRVKVTMGGELADMEFDDRPVVLFDQLTESDLSGRSLDIQLLDCEYCEGDDFDWTTTIGVCAKDITGNDLAANTMQVDCIFEPLQWLEEKASGVTELPPEEERAFPTVSARLTFSFKK